MIYVKCEQSKFPVLHNKLEMEMNSMNVMKFKEINSNFTACLYTHKNIDLDPNLPALMAAFSRMTLL